MGLTAAGTEEAPSRRVWAPSSRDPSTSAWISSAPMVGLRLSLEDRVHGLGLTPRRFPRGTTYGIT